MNYLLVSVYLNYNTLFAPDPGSFDNVHSIVLLGLYKNAIATLSAGLFSNLHSLVDIEFGINRLASVDKDMFPFNTAFVTFVFFFSYLGDNTLMSLSSKIPHSLYLLKGLYLISNQVKHFEDGTFANLSKLTHLSLEHNPFVFPFI